MKYYCTHFIYQAIVSVALIPGKYLISFILFEPLRITLESLHSLWYPRDLGALVLGNNESEQILTHRVFIHGSIHSSHRCLLSIYYVPGTVLRAEGTTASKSCENCHPCNLTFTLSR